MADIKNTWDFIVAGGGVVGLTIAQELRHRHRSATILVLEKEPRVGMHSSGRNSGVLHSGIYYKPGTLKAQMCAQGQREWFSYCDEHKLPIGRIGKVIVATRPEDQASMNTLCANGDANGVRYERIDALQLRQVEPDVVSATGDALFLPNTSVVDPLAIVHHLAGELTKKNIVIHHAPLRVNHGEAQTRFGTTWTNLDYGHLINCAGLHADTVAKQLGHDAPLEMIPVRGGYYKLAPESGISLRHLVYPVPDLAMPFLGVHFTNSVHGDTYVGPSAVPVLGREQYAGLLADPLEAARIAWRLCVQFARNKQNFRRYAIEEASKFMKYRFAQHAHRMAPKLEAKHLLPSKKCGIRPQLVNTKTGEMVMDMLVANEGRHTHVLNAISPAFTCAWPFSRYVVDKVCSAPATIPDTLPLARAS